MRTHEKPPQPHALFRARRRRVLTIVAALIVAGGLVRLATNDEAVETALPEPVRAPHEMAATLHVGMTTQLATWYAQQPAPLAKSPSYLPDARH